MIKEVIDRSTGKSLEDEINVAKRDINPDGILSDFSKQ